MNYLSILKAVMNDRDVWLELAAASGAGGRARRTFAASSHLPIQHVAFHGGDASKKLTLVTKGKLFFNFFRFQMHRPNVCSVNFIHRELDEYKVVQFEPMRTSHYSDVSRQQGGCSEKVTHTNLETRKA